MSNNNQTIRDEIRAIIDESFKNHEAIENSNFEHILKSIDQNKKEMEKNRKDISSLGSAHNDLKFTILDRLDNLKQGFNNSIKYTEEKRIKDNDNKSEEIKRLSENQAIFKGGLRTIEWILIFLFGSGILSFMLG